MIVKIYKLQQRVHEVMQQVEQHVPQVLNHHNSLKKKQQETQQAQHQQHQTTQSKPQNAQNENQGTQQQGVTRSKRSTTSGVPVGEQVNKPVTQASVPQGSHHTVHVSQQASSQAPHVVDQVVKGGNRVQSAVQVVHHGSHFVDQTSQGVNRVPETHVPHGTPASGQAPVGASSGQHGGPQSVDQTATVQTGSVQVPQVVAAHVAGQSAHAHQGSAQGTQHGSQVGTVVAHSGVQQGVHQVKQPVSPGASSSVQHGVHDVSHIVKGENVAHQDNTQGVTGHPVKVKRTTPHVTQVTTPGSVQGVVTPVSQHMPQTVNSPAVTKPQHVGAVVSQASQAVSQ
ncbi:hypothetical protein GQX74_002865 [Glossina fuscipes]|nr:hypothetical protein GQX74_002865 [Glossina fuscipes]